MKSKTIPNQPKFIIWLTNGLLITITLMMLIHTIIYLVFGASLIPFPFDYDQAEGYELNNAVLMAQGNCPYCDNDTFPFYGSGYPPVFHIIMIPFVWLFGPAFWYGRLIIFASTFITAFAIYWAVKRDTNHRWIALIAGLAFISSNYIYHIGPLLRQHLLMVMFETLAVVLVANAFSVDKSQRTKRLIIAFSLLLIAGFTKQLAYSTCIAVSIWVFLRNPKTAIRYALGLVIGAGIIFAFWMLVTDGQWWINIISANQNPFVDGQFVGLFRQFARLHWMLILMGSIVILYELYFDRLSIYSIWFIASAANTTLAGKWGAGDSYFDTWLVSACLLSGIFVGRTLQNQWSFPDNYITQFFRRFSIPNTRYAISLAGLGLFLLYSFTVFKIPTSGIFSSITDTLNIEPLPSWRYPLYDPAGWTVGYAVTGHLPTQDDIENGWRIVEAVQNTDGYVMSEDAGFSFQADREVITNGVQLKNLWENDLYDPANLLTMIENYEFGLIILRADLFPPPILVAIEEHYAIDEIIPMNGFGYELWRPKENAPNNESK